MARKSARKSSPLHRPRPAAVRCDARSHPSAGLPRYFPPLPLHLLPRRNESSLSNSTAFSGFAAAGFSRPNHPDPPLYPSRPSVRAAPVTALREPLCFSVPPPRRRPTRSHFASLLLSRLPPLPPASPRPPPTPFAAAELRRARPMPVITSSSLDDGGNEGVGGGCVEVEVLINQLAATRANRSRHTLRHAYRLNAGQSSRWTLARGGWPSSLNPPFPGPSPAGRC